MDLWTQPQPAQVKVVSLVPSIWCKGMETHLHQLPQSASCTFRPGPSMLTTQHLLALSYSGCAMLPSSLQDLLSLNPEGGQWIQTPVLSLTSSVLLQRSCHLDLQARPFAPLEKHSVHLPLPASCNSSTLCQGCAGCWRHRLIGREIKPIS